MRAVERKALIATAGTTSVIKKITLFDEIDVNCTLRGMDHFRRFGSAGPASRKRALTKLAFGRRQVTRNGKRTPSSDVRKHTSSNNTHIRQANHVNRSVGTRTCVTIYSRLCDDT